MKRCVVAAISLQLALSHPGVSTCALSHPGVSTGVCEMGLVTLHSGVEPREGPEADDLLCLLVSDAH